jgi:two-component system chemotaxis response regulator CheB
MSQVKLFKRQKFSPSKPVTPKQIQRTEAPSPHYGNQCELLAIGCSTGGPQALHKIFSLLPMSFPVPIVVTQHISLGFVGGLVSWLASNTLLKVKIAEQGESLLAGTIYFAPDDQHLMISRSFGNLAVMINSDAPCNGFRPSVNMMFNSVAQTCKNRALGALLTGMGTDGADGLLALRRAGSHTLVQDDASAVVYGMPGAAIAIDAADKVVALDDMSAYFSSMVRR